MIRLGNCYIGVSNNWMKMRGFPLRHTKRYPHERKDTQKNKRVKYHIMKKAGCKDELILKYLPGYFDRNDKRVNRRSKNVSGNR